MSELHQYGDRALIRYLGLVHAETDEPGNGIRAVYEARLEQTHTNGTVVQGGIVTAWLDNAMALAVIAGDPELQFASIDLQVSFIRVAKVGENHVTARIIEQGRSIMFLEAEVRNPEGQLVARATSAAKKIKPRP